MVSRPKIEQQIRVLAANYDAINKHDPAAVAALSVREGDTWKIRKDFASGEVSPSSGHYD
jgi:hypothetical protein